MAAEVNTEEVEDLALIKVCRGPDRGDAVERGVVAVEPDDEANTLLSATWKGWNSVI